MIRVVVHFEANGSVCPQGEIHNGTTEFNAKLKVMAEIFLYLSFR